MIDLSSYCFLFSVSCLSTTTRPACLPGRNKPTARLKGPNNRPFFPIVPYFWLRGLFVWLAAGGSVEASREQGAQLRPPEEGGGAAQQPCREAPGKADRLIDRLIDGLINLFVA